MKIESIKSYQLKNKNHDFTLISRDCIGGIVYHQLGLRFLSPTINLFFTPEDFNYFCLYLKEYIAGELKEYKDENVDYPVGLLFPKGNINLKPIRIDFMHYASFNEASYKWNERKKRINWNNIYVVSSFCYPGEVKTYSPEIVKKWNLIKYKKMIFVDQKYGFDNEYILNKPEECKEYAWLLFENDKNNPWKRTFNEFDFIKFLNE